MCHNSSACHACFLLAELVHSHFCIGKRNVGGFTRQPLRKRSNHWNCTQKLFLKKACTLVAVKHPVFMTTALESIPILYLNVVHYKFSLCV